MRAVKRRVHGWREPSVAALAVFVAGALPAFVGGTRGILLAALLAGALFLGLRLLRRVRPRRDSAEASLAHDSTEASLAHDSAKASLAHERHLMTSLLDSLPDQIHFKDADHRYLRVNPALARNLGLETPAAAVGLSDADFFPKAQALRTAALERRIMDSGEPVVDLEVMDCRPDRRPTWSLTTKMPLRDPAGRIIGTFGIAHDITEQRRAEHRLIEASSLLRAVLDAASEVSIIATDPNLTITVFNAGAEGLLGYSGAEMIGGADMMRLHDADEVRVCGEELTALLGHPVEGAEVFVEPSMLRRPHEWTYVRKDGARVTVSLVVTAMRTDRGELLGYVAVAHDVTRQRQYEESLQEAMDKAKLANRAKSEFLANMSHEIRTPMNAVIGLSYLLARAGLNAEQTALLSKINLASKSLLAVINDVLDLSKIEAGELTVECAPFSPRDRLQELADVMAVQANDKGIDFKLSLPDDLPAMMLGDATRLGQILANLLSNAIRFTDHGGVELRVVRMAGTATHLRLAFIVNDTGIGISPEGQNRLFTPYAQADASITRRYGGTGLGLSIVQSLAKLLGGGVTVQSTLGVGSRFCVEIEFALPGTGEPAVRQEAPDERGARGVLLGGVRVLVVDDSDTNLEVVRRILELEGARVSVARNGEEAFDLLQAQPRAYDIVLMDVQMPVLDGYAATRRIRAELGLTGLPIIALTAGAMSSERQRAAAAAMDDFVTKPFEAQALFYCILRHVRPAGRMPALPQDALRDRPASAPAAPSWPEIDGIDSKDVRARLSDDLGLFTSGLRRLLDEFSDLAIPAAAQGPSALHAYAARMHKLRGSAGMLGAKAIRKLAGEVELACREGDLQRAAQLATRLGNELYRLRDGAEAAIEAVAAARRAAAAACDTTPDGAACEPVEYDDAAIADLIELLRQQNLAALDSFGAVSARLRHQLGEQPHELLRNQISNLQFDAAAAQLEAVQRRG